MPRDTSKYDRRVHFLFNEKETKIIESISKRKGFATPESWIRSEANSFSRAIKEELICDQQGEKENLSIALPKDIMEFYRLLACQHSTTITTIISKLIIYPDIKVFLCEGEYKKP